MCLEDTTSETCRRDAVPTLLSSILTRKLSPPAEGSVIAGRYRVKTRIGAGGFGAVYEATQLSVQRVVAIKVLHGQLLLTREDVARFYREATATTRIRSPHVVQLLDFGADETTGTPYIAMELVGGSTLRRVMWAEGPLPAARAVEILRQVAKALMAAQLQGIVHRDLKPANVMLSRTVDGEDFAKVMDFGLAKLAPKPGDELQGLTNPGALLGTPAAMAPEQISGGSVDARTDLYALGCMLFEMLTGRPMFKAPDNIGLLSAHLTAPPPELPDDLEVPPEVVDLYARLVQKDPANRPESAAAVVGVLGPITGRFGSHPTPPELDPLASLVLEEHWTTQPISEHRTRTPARAGGGGGREGHAPSSGADEQPVGFALKAVVSSKHIGVALFLAVLVAAAWRWWPVLYTDLPAPEVVPRAAAQPPSEAATAHLPVEARAMEPGVAHARRALALSAPPVVTAPPVDRYSHLPPRATEVAMAQPRRSIAAPPAGRPVHARRATARRRGADRRPRPAPVPPKPVQKGKSDKGLWL